LSSDGGDGNAVIHLTALRQTSLFRVMSIAGAKPCDVLEPARKEIEQSQRDADVPILQGSRATIAHHAAIGPLRARSGGLRNAPKGLLCAKSSRSPCRNASS